MQGGLAHIRIGNARSLCTAGALPILYPTTKVPTGLRDGRVQKNSGGKWEAYYQPQVSTGKRRSLSALVPLSLTTQVTDQWKFACLVP